MGGSSRSSSTTTTVTQIVEKTVYRAPSAPPAQQVISAGNVSRLPSVSSIGSTRIVSALPDLPAVAVRYASPPNAYTTVPFVPHLQPAVPVGRPSINESLAANNDIILAQSARDDLCNDVLTNPLVGAQNFNITGNGGATRWRFPVRGAPTNLVVTDLSTGSVVSADNYSVSIRGDSFSWIIFNTAPANGISFNISFEVGDSNNIRVVRATDWNGWQLQLREIEKRVANVRNATNSPYSNTRYVGSNRVTSWSIGDPTLIEDAQTAIRDLRGAIKRPGMRMNVGEVAGICDYLNSQLARIENDLDRVEYVGGVRPATGGSAPYGSADPAIASRIYQNDIRYSYFTGPDTCANYAPPNAGINPVVCYKKQFDNISGRFYYTTG